MMDKVRSEGLSCVETSMKVQHLLLRHSIFELELPEPSEPS
jgi:hypothetical protein